MIVDLRRDASTEDIEQEIKGMKLGLIDEAMTRWAFKHMLLKSAHRIADIESLISQTPLAKGGLTQTASAQRQRSDLHISRCNQEIEKIEARLQSRSLYEPGRF